MSESYDYRSRKTVAVISNKIQTGQAMNVLGHLALAIGHATPPDWMGRIELPDKSGILHRGISKYPFIITRIKPSSIRKALQRARENTNLIVADFPRQMLDTGHDSELAASIAAADESTMEYLGIVISGPASEVNEITGKFSLWKDDFSTLSSEAPTESPTDQ